MVDRSNSMLIYVLACTCPAAAPAAEVPATTVAAPAARRKRYYILPIDLHFPMV